MIGNRFGSSQNTGNKGFIGLIKKKILVIISLLAVVILFLTLIILFISKNSGSEYQLIDMLGRQRTTTQMLAKDANRKYAIMQTLQNGPMVESQETFMNRIDELNSSMLAAEKQFTATLSSLNSGIFETSGSGASAGSVDALLEKTSRSWDAYSNAVDIIITGTQANSETAEALVYINLNNDDLLSDCEQITQWMISTQDRHAQVYIAAALCLFGVSFAALFFSILELYKYIVQPLDALFKGVGNLGILNKSVLPSRPAKNELLPVIDEIDAGFTKLNKLIVLVENLNRNIPFEGILEHIFYSFSDYIPYSHIGIALLKQDGTVLEASYGISDPSLRDLPKKLLGIKAKLSETSLEDVITNGTPRVINDLPGYVTKSGRGKTYNRILLQAGVRSSIALPLKINSKPIGVLFFSSTAENMYGQQHITFLEMLSNSIAISLQKNIFIDELLYSTILALAKMAEARDANTGGHLQRMKKYSVAIAEYLLEDHIYEETLSLGFLRDIERFSPMHDIGKVGIRDGILLKPGKLTAEEFDEMKNHTIYGAEVLRTAERNIQKQNRSLFRVGIEIAEGHHERWDGTGYPYHKSGENIPLSARIVAAADVFDALTSDRPYKRAYSFEESFSLVIQGKGKQFDPRIIDAMSRHQADIYRLYKSFLSKSFSAISKEL